MSINKTSSGSQNDQAIRVAPLKADENNIPAAPAIPYSIFTKWEKRYIVFLIAFAAWFSTTSSFIYYPVIKLIARDLNTSVSKINLTVTSYLAVSAIVPSLMGDAADKLGRRVTYIFALLFYVISNVGIALQRSFAALLCLRMLQSAAISATFSMAYGVIMDISSPHERGAYVGAVSFGVTAAPSLAPLLSGAFGYGPGWRWVFWFLALSSGACFIFILFSLPETARRLVDNGSVQPPNFAKSPIPFMKHWNPENPPRELAFKFPNPLNCLKILTRKDSAITISANGIFYIVYSCLQASLSTLCIEIYGLNQLEAGLIYLPFGVAEIVAALTSGKIIDRDYRLTAIAYGISTNKVSGDDLLTFPIEEARLKSIFVPIALTVGGTIGYGWTLQTRTHIAVPLILQFILGYTMQICFNMSNSLIVDINHHSPATAQAASNIVRCTLAAVAVAILQEVIDAIGPGWTFTVIGSLNLICVVIYIVERRYGMKWRTGRTLERVKAVALVGNMGEGTHVAIQGKMPSRDYALTKM